MKVSIISTLLIFCFFGMQKNSWATLEFNSNIEFEAIDIYDQTPLPAPPVPPRKDLGETQYKAPSPQPAQPKLPAPPVPPRRDLGETQYKAPSPQPGTQTKPKASNPYGQIPPARNQYGQVPAEKPANTSGYSKLPPPSSSTANPRILNRTENVKSGLDGKVKQEMTKNPSSPYGQIPKANPYGSVPKEKSNPYGQIPAEKPANNSGYGKLPPPDNYTPPKNQYGAIPPKEKTTGQYGQSPKIKTPSPYGQIPAEKPTNNSGYGKLPPPDNYTPPKPKSQYGAVPPKKKTPGQYGASPKQKATGKTPSSKPATKPTTKKPAVKKTTSKRRN